MSGRFFSLFSLALKIHVSEDCYRLLKEIGGYIFLKRGEVYLKVISKGLLDAKSPGGRGAIFSIIPEFQLTGLAGFLYNNKNDLCCV